MQPDQADNCPAWLLDRFEEIAEAKRAAQERAALRAEQERRRTPPGG